MFLSDLIVRADIHPDYWVLEQDLLWKDPTFGTLIVPEGFRTDLESVPFMVRGIPWIDSVFDPDGVTRRPAAGHDFLYAWRKWGKDKSDEFLRAAIMSEGGSSSVARTVYLGVHWFGGHAWSSDAGSIDKYNFSKDSKYADWLKTQD